MSKLQKLKQYLFPISKMFALVMQTHKDLQILQQE